MRRTLLAFALLGATLALDAGAIAAPKGKGKATRPITLPAAKKPPKETKPKDVKPPTRTPEKATESTPAPDTTGVPTGELRGPTRIDFDDRLIQGQTNKSGAVYLFDRKETGISSMVRRRKSFRQLTLGTIYDR